MSANGKVCTGFSKPYVANYSASGGIVTYSNARPLARGVEVDISPDTSDDNKFYADNVEAENASGIFTGGTATITVDGLFMSAERMIMGLPAVGEDGFTAYGDSQKAPYMGFGYIARYMSEGVTTYVPTVLAKIKFSQPSSKAKTQEDNIDWQTQELTANIMRGDDANHNWKYVGSEYSTEDEAEVALKGKLGIKSYSVTQALTSVTSTIDAAYVEDGSALSGTLSVADGYTMGTVSVIMGELDITSTAYNASTKAINIDAVTANVTITATAYKQTTFTFMTSYGSALFDLYLNNEAVSWHGFDSEHPYNNTDVTIKAGDVLKVVADCTATYTDGGDTETNMWKNGSGTKLGNGNTLTYTVTGADVDAPSDMTLGFNGSSATKGGTGNGYYMLASDFVFSISTT